jgi:hypothetical protein
LAAGAAGFGTGLAGGAASGFFSGSGAACCATMIRDGFCGAAEASPIADVRMVVASSRRFNVVM